jgi:hypothetical protein
VESSFNARIFHVGHLYGILLRTQPAEGMLDYVRISELISSTHVNQIVDLNPGDRHDRRPF